MNFLAELPGEEQLLALYPEIKMLNVNAHIHTPYSFSAFHSIGRIFEMAVDEGISVAGINDFFVTDGYEAFCDDAIKACVFPLFNIEFIGLLKPEQKSGTRINDPNNAGRCYFCGKGLNYPFGVDPSSGAKLAEIISLSQDQMREMVEKMNVLFTSLNSGIVFDYAEIRKKYASGIVRERHLAKAVRIAVHDQYPGHKAFMAMLTRVFGGKSPKSSPNDIPAMENEIRANLLKSGGTAFVEEDEASFLNLDEIKEIIINAGGIPCYPMLLDDKNGMYTEFEKTPEHLCYELQKRHIGCVEVIPGRNNLHELERYIAYFHKKNFIILFGTEHNAPDKIPLTCNTRGNQPLPEYLRRISYEGACVVAAHQYLKAKNKQGFTEHEGKTRNDQKNNFIQLGNAVIHYFQTMQKQAK
jgi:hypothetical protein